MYQSPLEVMEVLIFADKALYDKLDKQLQVVERRLLTIINFVSVLLVVHA